MQPLVLVSHEVLGVEILSRHGIWSSRLHSMFHLHRQALNIGNHAGLISGLSLKSYRRPRRGHEKTFEKKSKRL